MLRALRTWLTGQTEASRAQAALDAAKLAYDAAVARKDSRDKHYAFQALRIARADLIRAEIALSKSRSRRSRSERGTHEMAGGFR